jgi:hypothetical protein
MTQGRLRRGDLIEVRAPADILATLDEHGCLEGLPFMPEMLVYCGRRLQVDSCADKVCDTVLNSGSRKLPDAVLLADLRCNGSGHDGCQAECRIFWKDAWLRKVAADDPPSPAPAAQDLQALSERVQRNVKRNITLDSRTEERWSCQLTKLYEATEAVKLWDPRPYLNEYANGNVSLGHCLSISARAAVEEPLRRLGIRPMNFRGSATGATPAETLDLQPGEWVQVRSLDEILATLNPGGFNRGMWFDREMGVYCGGTYRVWRRITRFIDDGRDNGKMIEMKTDAVTLENVFCTGNHSPRRWFCPRKATPYWRECWLRRVPAPDKLERTT